MQTIIKILKYILISPLLLFIKLYQLILSPLLPNSCRHYPTCSHYASEALQKHGFFKGFVLALWRILRCNPWGTSGFDPVPDKFILKRKK